VIDVNRAGEQIESRIAARPDVGIILGSGLGGLEDDVEQPVHIPYAEIPGFPPVSVTGHDGILTTGRIAGLTCAIMRGRYHRYEGHSAELTALPTRVLARLGVRTMMVTNSAGGLWHGFRPGDLMLIDDHINFMWSNPLVGRVAEGEVRFPDMSAPYDPELQRMAEEVALGERIPLRRGVYVALLGPSYETPAEVRMLRRLGGDAVGMSTVPEVLAARAAGVAVMGVSLIANAAAGMTAEKLHHDDVIQAAAVGGPALRRLLLGVISRLGEAGRND
jgi:purine-nucleoside phosphorylase